MREGDLSLGEQPLSADTGPDVSFSCCAPRHCWEPLAIQTGVKLEKRLALPPPPPQPAHSYTANYSDAQSYTANYSVCPAIPASADGNTFNDCSSSHSSSTPTAPSLQAPRHLSDLLAL